MRGGRPCPGLMTVLKMPKGDCVGLSAESNRPTALMRLTYEHSSRGIRANMRRPRSGRTNRPDRHRLKSTTMAETHSSQALLALLAAEASEQNDDALTGVTATERSDEFCLPKLDQRTDMFLKAVYGSDYTVTPEIRLAVRNRLLSAMAANLAEETIDSAAEATVVPHGEAARTRIVSPMSDGFSQIRASAGDAWQKMVSSAAELF